MSLRSVDARYLLPEPPSTAAVLAGAAGWADGLLAAGVSLTADQPDLVVAGAPAARAAVERAAPAVLLLGGGGKLLRRQGYHVRQYVSVPGPNGPRILAPIRDGHALRYAMTWLFAPVTGPKRARNALLASVVGRRLLTRGEHVVTVGLAQPGPPWVLRAAARQGAPTSGSWLLHLSPGDDLTRAVFLSFPPGSAEPSVAVKFARGRGSDPVFAAEAAALSLAATAGIPNIPRLLTSFRLDGNAASVETAAAGEHLGRRIARVAERAARSDVERVAKWILEMGRRTAGPAEELAPERRRLAMDVLPRWPASARSLVAELPPVPAVLAHHDLGTWNVQVSPVDFAVVDWECAVRPALPLWDLLYFLTDALGLIDGNRTQEERFRHAVALHAGELPASRLLFDWMRRGAQDSGVPMDAVGRIATLCWLHHGLSRYLRANRLATGLADAATGDVSPAAKPVAHRLAPVWLDHPRLGPDWPAFAEGAR